MEICTKWDGELIVVENFFEELKARAERSRHFDRRDRRIGLRRSLLLVAAVVVATSACAANSHVGLGTRVRISASEVSSDRLVGEVSSLGDDTVALRLDESMALQPVPLALVERIEVSRGFVRGNQVLIFAGTAIGTAVGVAVAVPIWSEDCDEQAQCDLNKLGAVMVILVYMGVGLITGWLVGVPFFEYERWKQVPLDRLRVSVVPQRDGRFALGLSVAF